MAFLEQPAFEIGRRVEIRGGNTWVVVLGPDTTNDSIAGFIADLSASLNGTVRAVTGAGSMDGLLTALASPADDPVLMAEAMKYAVLAGRAAYLAGRMPKKLYATASSPMQGVVR